jgi:hypothetical protein
VDLTPTGGVTVTRDTGEVFGAYQDHIQFDAGRIYAQRGDIVDPVNHRRVGVFSVPFLRGDTNSDARVNVADMAYYLQYQFLRGPTPTCLTLPSSNFERP